MQRRLISRDDALVYWEMSVSSNICNDLSRSWTATGTDLRICHPENPMNAHGVDLGGAHLSADDLRTVRPRQVINKLSILDLPTIRRPFFRLHA